MIVVFDTNIWLENLYLRSPAGVATRFYLARQASKVALPEVVRLEVETHLRRELRNYIAEIKYKHDSLLAIFGTLKSLRLPTQEDIETTVDSVFDSLGVDLVEVPFSMDSARSSFLKTIQGLPPSDRSQQFKDGVLWADCMKLLAEQDVVLVTKDKAFYKGHDYSRGLSVHLMTEAKCCKNKLTILPELSALLREIQTSVSINENALATAFLDATSERYLPQLARSGFKIGDRRRIDTELFLTEDPEKLFLNVDVDFECHDISGEGRTNAILNINGDGFYHVKTGEFSNLSELGDMFRYRDSDGEQKEMSGATIRIPGLSLGHSTVAHTLRQKLAQS